MNKRLKEQEKTAASALQKLFPKLKVPQVPLSLPLKNIIAT